MPTPTGILYQVIFEFFHAERSLEVNLGLLGVSWVE